MITVVAASFKGGTGKTSACLHLASALSLFHRKKWLLVDFDPQANLTSSLGFSTDDLDTIEVSQEFLDRLVADRQRLIQAIHVLERIGA